MPAGQRIVGRDIPRNLCSHHQPDIAFSQLRQADRGFGPVRFVGHALLPGTDGRDGLPQVAVPLHGIHAEVEVCVYREYVGGLRD